MRRATVALLTASALLVNACGDDDDASSDATSAPTNAPSTAATTGDGDDDAAACTEGKTLKDGMLTMATGNPAFPPYVIDDAPESGEGFEAAVAYAVAEQMGFGRESVGWVRTSFDEAIQPGKKNFDLNLQQYSITPQRERNITFSDPYYTTNQAIVGFDDSAAVGATTVDELRGLKIGVQSGTTSLGFVTDVIQPDDESFVYNDNTAAKQGMQSNQIDAIVVDLPTAFYITEAEIPKSTIIGQFPVDAGGASDEFGMVLDKDNPLVDCVNMALATLTTSGELDAITEQWMTGFADAPVIEVE